MWDSKNKTKEQKETGIKTRQENNHDNKTQSVHRLTEIQGKCRIQKLTGISFCRNRMQSPKNRSPKQSPWSDKNWWLPKACGEGSLNNNLATSEYDRGSLYTDLNADWQQLNQSETGRVCVCVWQASGQDRRDVARRKCMCVRENSERRGVIRRVWKGAESKRLG